jgi:WD40 repeat protein
METIKVLLFAASPQGTSPLDLPREFREIDEEVRLSKFRDRVELILVPGARPVDLLRKLNENQPQVVHFSSHGDPDHLVLESGGDEAEGRDPLGAGTRSVDQRDLKPIRPPPADPESTGPIAPQLLSKSALVNVLRSCDEGSLKLVVLNACHTRSQAEALTEVVDCVVSMKRAITDRAAIQFAASFYGALAFGRSVQKAFEQGVARLSAEGIGEVDTPELLVRAGVDASRVVLLGPKPGQPPTPAAEAPFLVPFPRNGDFVGRDGDLRRLHVCLFQSAAGPVGIRPAGLTGMGGIGKTQLAVEYVYRRREDYPDGVFWIDAAGPLAEGFARLAADARLRWAEPDRPRDEQIRAAFVALNGRAHALLVLDNLPDPAAIAVPLLPDCVPEDLRCRLLFTTRRHDLGRFAGVEVTVLPEEPALRLLLRHPSCRAALDPAHPDHEHARAIARMLGRLPLALELAGAYLGKYSGDVSLEGYREGLKSEGLLATLDADAAELTEADLRRVHDPAVAATIGEQWAALKDESARLLLRVASLFPESSAVPTARLGLLAGLADKAPSGRPSPLRRAVKRLDDACLVERLETDQLRLHPLIREFAAGQVPGAQQDLLRRQCLERAAAALEQHPTLEALDVERGVDGMQEDLIAILELCPPSAPDLGARVQAVLRLLQREANDLRINPARSQPTLFAQQVRNRAVLLGIAPLQASAERRLSEQGQPHFRLLWTASLESPALIRTLTGRPASAVSVTPDARYAISGSRDGSLAIWDLRTGQHLRTFVGHAQRVTAVAVTPDGRQVLSASYDAILKLWDLQTGRLLRACFGHEDAVKSVAVTSDGRSALSASHDGTLKLWDLATGRLVRSLVTATASGELIYDLATGEVLPSSYERFTAVALTPDDRQVLAGSEDRVLRLWDLRTGDLLRIFEGHDDGVTGVVVTPDGRSALSSSFDRTLKLWDLRSGQLLQSFAGHRGGVTGVSVTPDGRQAVSASYDSTLKLWDLPTGQLVHSFEGHEESVTAVAVTGDGRHAVSSSDDRTIRLWSLRAGTLSGRFEGHAGSVNAVAVTPDGRHAVSASFDRTLKLWDLPTGQLRLSCTEEEKSVTAVAVTPDGRHALSGSGDRTLKLWELETGRLCRTFAGHKSWVTAVAVTPDGRHALSGSDDRTLKLWDLETGRLLRTFTGHERVVRSVAVLPDGRHALSGSHDRTVKLWDLETGELCRTLTGSWGWVNAVAVTPDGRYALLGSSTSVKLWDLETGQLRSTLAGHRSWVSAVKVSPDGRSAISGSDDCTLRLWDLEDQRCRAIVPLESAPWTVAFAPDGRTVVVGDRVGNVHQFEIRLS